MRKSKKRKKIHIGQILVALFWILLVFALVTFNILYDPDAQYSGNYLDDVAKSMRR